MAEEDQTTAAAETPREGLIRRFAKNPVAANLVMLLLIVGGLLMASRVQQEVFPEVTLDQVVIDVPFPGSNPEEVEDGVILAIEEAVRGIDGVKEVRSTAAEGAGRVMVELRSSVDRNRALSDVKSEVDAIQSFPENAERPLVGLTTNRREVVSLIVSGDVGDRMLRNASERVRSDLLRDERITQVEVTGLPLPEISIEVPQAMQRRYGLTLPQIADRVRQASLDLPGGSVETNGGEVLIRTTEEKEQIEAFSDITLIARPDGSRVRLGDVAEIEDTVRDGVDKEAYLDGKPAARVRVYRVGRQTPMEVSEAVTEYLDGQGQNISDQLSLTVWNDQSKIFAARIALLLENAALGVLLVIIILGVFLDIRLAFWVTLGIPISFLGAVLFMPALGVSINMISLFAFILALGIVVDDAIVVGESIHAARKGGATGVEAAVAGAKAVKAPVLYAVITTIVAFTPLMFVPGVTGEFFDNIPMVVIPILILSLVESFLVLPAHLAHGGSSTPKSGVLGAILERQSKLADGLERFVERFVEPAAWRIVRRRYLTFSIALAVLFLAVGTVAGGHIRFRFLPEIEGDVITAAARLPFGSSMDVTRGLVDDLRREIRDIGGEAAKRDDEANADDLVEHVYAEIGTPAPGGASDASGNVAAGSHLATVQVKLLEPGKRSTPASDLTEKWRAAVGTPAGVDRVDYAFGIGPPTGAAVAIQLSHPERDTLEKAAGELAGSLRQFDGVIEVDDGVEQGKPQLDLELRPSGRALGLQEVALAQQVRANFFGAEARRQQRGRFELRVYVRRPEDERRSVHDFESLIIRTPDGGEIPLDEVAYTEWSSSSTSIERVDGRRITTVTADVTGRGATPGEVVSSLEQKALPKLVADHPDLSWSPAGEQEEQAESLSSLKSNMLIALIVMYGLMAVAFRSYLQPVALMIAIPFGLVGALAGHLLLGFDLSIISVLGLVALSGVVVNDSLVLVSRANDLRDDLPLQEALVEAMKSRFRPIVLTSLTTFLGLTPMILESSIQARFLIPMALSLGFGVLFVTLIALAVVPSVYLILEDGKRAAGRAWAWVKSLYGSRPPQPAE